MIISWWLNVACAFRDGIVGETKKQATLNSTRAVTALTLLRGKETDGIEVDTYEYRVNVFSKDMMASLLSQRGRSIRLLRGYELDSKYAPEFGVRYDGL